eukprot:1025860-Prymnesium_polylepis.1
MFISPSEQPVLGPFASSHPRPRKKYVLIMLPPKYREMLNTVCHSCLLYVAQWRCVGCGCVCLCAGCVDYELCFRCDEEVYTGVYGLPPSDVMSSWDAVGILGMDALRKSLRPT